MKRFYIIINVLLVFSALSTKAQDIGAGIHLGDPLGLTVKSYMGDRSIELTVGRSHVLTRNRFYSNRFNDWYIDNRFAYANINYVSFRSSTPLGIQLHYNFIDKKIDVDIPGKLKWYIGVGAQLRFQRIIYTYDFRPHGDTRWYRGEERITDFDFGADFAAGVEYLFDDIPISVYVDLVLFAELVDDPFYFWGQGGLGVRYLF